MKIILFDPETSGHHIKYASYLIRYLIEQGDIITFITWKPCKSLNLLQNLPITIKYIVGSSEENFGGNTIKRKWQLVKGFKYCFNLANVQHVNVVHCLYIDYSEIPLYFCIKKFKHRSWKLFATIFSPYFIHEPKEKIGIMRYLYHKLKGRIVVQLLKRGEIRGLFTHSERIQDKLFNLCSHDLFCDNIFVIPDPIEPLPKISQEVARDYLELPQKKPIILFFGGLNHRKGFDVLLKAIPLIDKEVYILIAGKLDDSIEEETIQKYRQSLRKPECLIFHLRYIKDGDIAKYFLASDAVILPYRRGFKGTSGVLNYASVTGKPVIVSDTGEISHIVRENNLGILIEPESSEAIAQGVKRLLSHSKKWREQVKLQAIQYAKSNDWRKMASKVREIYLKNKE